MKHYDQPMERVTVGSAEEIIDWLAGEPTCPTCKGPNKAMGFLATAYFPYCSQPCQDKGMVS